MAETYIEAQKKQNADQLFLIYASEGNFEKVKETLPNVQNREVKNEAGMSALVLAIKSKNSQIVKYLLDEGFDYNSKNNVSLLSS